VLGPGAEKVPLNGVLASFGFVIKGGLGRAVGTVVAGRFVITGRNVIDGDPLHRNNSLLRQYKLDSSASRYASVEAVSVGWGLALRWCGAHWETFCYKRDDILVVVYRVVTSACSSCLVTAAGA
jgi:hypothetical protein